MKRNLVVSTVVAMLMVLGLAVTAMAAGPGPNAIGVPGTLAAGEGAAVNGTFVDENVDGVCDTYTERVPALDGAGNAWNTAQTTVNSWWGAQGDVDAGFAANMNAAGYAAAGYGAAGNGLQLQDGTGLTGSNVAAGIGTQPVDGTGFQYRNGGSRWN